MAGLTGGGFFRGNEFYCYYPDDLYAEYIELENPSNHFSNFLIRAQIAVGSCKGKNVKDVFFKLTFNSLNSEDPPIEIVSIAPSDQTKIVGMVNTQNTTSTEMGGSLTGGVDEELIAVNLHAKGRIGKNKRKIVSEKFEYPKEIQVVRSGAAGKDAFWQFKQGEIEGRPGQYDLNIFFRIRKPFEEIRGGKGYYGAIPKVKINGYDLKQEIGKEEIQPIPVDFLKD